MANYASFQALYGLVLWAGAVLSLALAGIAWQRRSAPGAVPLIVLSLAAAWWMFCYVVPLPAMSRSEALFLRFRLIFPGVVFIVPAMLAFGLQYTGRMTGFRWRILAPLLIEPAIVLLAVWWPGLQDAFFGSWRGRPEDGHFKGGPLFWAHTLYSYAILSVTYALLILHYRRESLLYRKQIRLLLIGALIPLAFNVITVSRVLAPNIDISPIGLALSAAVMAVALFRGGLLKLIPVAREKIIRVMRDGVLVVDSKGRVVDSNPAACEILDLGRKTIEGKPIADAFPYWDSSAAGTGDARAEIYLAASDRYVELNAIPLADAKGASSGTLLVLHDVTAARTASNALEQANAQLRAQLLEIESMQNLLRQQAIRDPLTGLFNRRYLEETLQRELSQNQRDKKPMALILIDIDHFKEINDVHGHACGDAILRALGDLLLRKSRAGDAACRYGGEEFVVVLSGTTLETAVQRAEQWRAEFAGMSFPFQDTEVRAGFSAGIALFPQHGSSEDALLKAADRALYAAKAAGRNNVQVAQGRGLLPESRARCGEE